jgi:hypothetical protein
MTDKINKTQLKLKNAVYNFLDANRNSEERKIEPTHQSYGLFRGVFSLDKDQYKIFMDLYTKAIEADVKDFSILERQKDYAPIIVDVDLEIPSDSYESGTRLYSNELVLNVMGKYIDAIKTYLDPDTKVNRIWLFEKPSAREKDSGVYADGFHIMFPNLCVEAKMRHLIRTNVIKMCHEDDTFDGFINGPEAIIDKNVVSSNGWFLYGSSKPNRDGYTLSAMYDFSIRKLYDHKEGTVYNVKTGESAGSWSVTNAQIIKTLSLQSKQYTKKNATPILDAFAESDIEAECEKLGINSSVRAESNVFTTPTKEDEVRRACKYASILSSSRADDYHDWMHVGLALHNIDHTLLPVWIEFSKKSRKFKTGECEKIWRTMKNPSNGNVLTIRSLAFWAKQDDPKQFESFNKEEFKQMMKKSLDGNTYYLAKSVYAKYADRFVCSSITGNIWWEFKNHRWIKIQDGYTLKILLSEDFANEYNREIADISLKLTQVSGIEKEELQSRRSRIDKIVEKLMNTSFKDLLMKEAKNFFYDNKFDEKLDSNLQLIGFENGVFDLDKGVFRDGRPDDYITFSTKNDYNKWTDKNPYKASIEFDVISY